MGRSGLNNFLRPTQIKAVVGLHKISEFRRPSKHDDNNSADTTDKSAYEMGLKQIVVHPEYQCQHPDNDIGKQRRFHGRLKIVQTIPFSISFFFLFKQSVVFIWCDISSDSAAAIGTTNYIQRHGQANLHRSCISEAEQFLCWWIGNHIRMGFHEWKSGNRYFISLIN